MSNYRQGKERYKVNSLGSLYFNRQNYDSSKRPTIYIGGQMEHRLHLLEQTGFTSDEGHNLFDGSWFYDYPYHANKSELNAQNFSNNLIQALEIAKLDEVDLITDSYGGLIGLYATSSKHIHKVVAIHPPILGSPLANAELINSKMPQLGFKNKWLCHLINLLIDNAYGFEQENSQGIYNPTFSQAQLDLSKYIVSGSSIDPQSEKNALLKSTACLIKELTNQESDGVVVYNLEELKALGIAYETDPIPLNHFSAGTKENYEKVHKLLLKR